MSMDRYETAAEKWYENKWKYSPCPGNTSVAMLATFLREQFPEQPGRCGECAEVTEDSVAAPSCHCGKRKIWVFDNMSCPYFKARADKYEELAREFVDEHWPINDWTEEKRDEIRKNLTGFLAMRVTVRESHE